MAPLESSSGGLRSAIEALEAPTDELRELARLAGATIGPSSVGLILTSACNLRCRYCYQTNRSGRAMPWPTARRAIDLLLASGEQRPRVTFFGGEPLLEKQLLRRVVAYTESRRQPSVRPSYRLTTNGTLLEPEILTFLASHQVRTVVSFDGAAEAQDLRAEGSGEGIADMLRWASSECPEYFSRHVEVRITLSSANLRVLAQSVDHLLGLGLRQISIAAIFTHDPGWHAELEEELDRQFGRIAASCEPFVRRGEPVPVLCLRSSARQQRRRPAPHWMCGAASGRRAVIDPDGVAWGCSAFVGSLMPPPGPAMWESAAAMRIARLDDRDFVDRFEIQTYELQSLRPFGFKSRKRSSLRQCADCEAIHQCVVCPASIVSNAGPADPDRIPDLQCSFNSVLFRWRKTLKERGPPPELPGG